MSAEGSVEVEHLSLEELEAEISRAEELVQNLTHRLTQTSDDRR